VADTPAAARSARWDAQGMNSSRRLIAPITAAVLAAFAALGGSALANNATKPTPRMPAAQTQTARAAAVTAPIAGYEIVTSEFLKVSPNSQASGSALCPPGKKALGGGAFGNAATPVEHINTSMPLSNGGGWNIAMDNTSGVQLAFQVYAVCALAN
jgi:hypothetical protein